MEVTAQLNASVMSLPGWFPATVVAGQPVNQPATTWPGSLFTGGNIN